MECSSALFPFRLKEVEEKCTHCGSNHSFNVCPMTRGGYESPVYHDNFQQFQQTASVGNFVQNGNAGYLSPTLANHTHTLVFLTKYKGKTSNQADISLIKEWYLTKVHHKILKLCLLVIGYFQKTTARGMQAGHDLGEFKNELKSQHNLFMNQQNDFQNNLQNMLSGFFQNQSQPSTSTSMVPTTLPSNTITNPRCEARAITTRSGLSYTPVPPIPPSFYDVNDALILMPKYQKMLKSLLSNKEKLNEMAKTPMNANCSAVILKKLPEKLGAQDDFLIPYFVADPRVPLILGRPFLRTARVLIDVHGEELVIRDGLERIVFKPDGSQGQRAHPYDGHL
ncbi:hypothetical protein Tco_1401769 [Tanacetum coccineum]